MALLPSFLAGGIGLASVRVREGAFRPGGWILGKLLKGLEKIYL
jgi:hypothetical protein